MTGVFHRRGLLLLSLCCLGGILWLVVSCVVPLSMAPTLPPDPIPASGASEAAASATPQPTPSATATRPRSLATATVSPTPTATLTATLLPTPTVVRPLIALDPGHGGLDVGACHRNEQGLVVFCESEINLALTLRLRAVLEERGYRVFMTREEDVALNPDWLDVNEDGILDHADELQARVDMINEAGADLLLSIHQNSFYWSANEPATDVGGTVTFYCADRPFAEQSLRFAQLTQEALVAALQGYGYDVHDRGVEVDLVLVTPDEPGTHLIILGPESERIARPSQMPGILSETLFISHAKEAKLLRNPEVLDLLALAYAEAIEAFWAGGAVGAETPGP